VRALKPMPAMGTLHKMAHKLITFLGTESKDTLYAFPDGIDRSGEIFPLALLKYCEFDEVLVCMTPRAREALWKKYRISFEKSGAKPIDIASGQNSDELLEILEKINAEIEEGDTISFDVTHGLRSIPFLVFLLIAFLKTAGHIQLGSIYYGALELVDPDKNSNVAPVIDLADMVRMLDWIDAANLITQTGSAHQLSQLLAPDDQPLAQAINLFSQSLLACQPNVLAKRFESLQRMVVANEPLAGKRPLGFRILQNKLLETFGQLSSEPTQGREFLAAEFRLIEWYLQNNHAMQAATLAREWVLDGVFWMAEQTIEFDYQKRERAQPYKKYLDSFARLGEELKDSQAYYGVQNLNQGARQFYEQHTQAADLMDQAWGRLNLIRNTLCHAGHREEEELLSVDDAIKQLYNDVFPVLRNLAVVWELPLDKEVRS